MAKKKQTPRDPDKLLVLARALIDENTKRNELYDRLDKLYDQIPAEQAANPDVQIVRTAYGTSAIDLVADLAADMKLSIEVPAASESKKSQQEADDTEQWLAAWLALNEQRTHANLTRDAAWYAAQRGMCVMRTLFLGQSIDKDADEYVMRSLPVLLQVRDPRQVYVREGADGPRYVVEVATRTAGDVRSLYPDALSEDDYEDDDDVEWVEYWDDKVRCYWAAGEPVKVGGKGVVPHGLGCLPYSFGVARSTPRSKPEQKYRPLLSSVEDALHNIDTWFSILATAGWAAVTNSWLVFSDRAGEGQGKILLSTGPGDINYLAPDDKVAPLQRANLPSDFFQLGNLLMQQFQQGTFPFAMYGQTEGSMAGYAINMLSQSGRRPLTPIYAAVCAAFEGAFRNCLIICREKVAPLIKKQEIPLVVRGSAKRSDGAGERTVKRKMTLDVDSVGDDFDCAVTLGDPMPADEASNLRMAVEATKGGLLSRQTARTKYKLVPDAVDEQDRIYIEAIMDQLAPKEMMKLAVERGYAPRQQVEPQQDMQRPLDIQGMMGAAQQMMGGQGKGQPNPADLQQMSGMPQQPTLDQMAGVPPALPAQLGQGGM